MGGRTRRGGAGCWPAAAERSDPSAASPLAAHHRVSADFPAHAPDPAREAGLTHSPLRQQKDLEDGAGRAAGHSGRQPHAHSQPISAPSFSLSLAPRHVTVAARKPVPPPDLLLPHTPPDACAPSYMSADCRSQNRTRRNCFCAHLSSWGRGAHLSCLCSSAAQHLREIAHDSSYLGAKNGKLSGEESDVDVVCV